MWPPELESLDQLQARDLPLTVIAMLYATSEAFRKCVTGLLLCGDVLLLDAEDNAVPKWQWRKIFGIYDSGQHGHYRLRLTPQGARRIG